MPRNLLVLALLAGVPASAAAQSQLWLRQFGTNSQDLTGALCPDGAGGTFAAGYTAGSLAAPHAGGWDAWLARYDGEGNRLWLRQFGTSGEDSTLALCPDGAGGALAAGPTSGGLGGANAGSDDIWLARFDSAGNQTWIRQFGSGGQDYATGLWPDGAGGAFAAGWTGGSLGAPNAGGNDAWLARYDSAGNQTWIRQFGTSGDENASGVCPDGAGGAFIAGYTSGSLAGPNAGFRDAWLARYDSAGNQTWIRQFGTSTNDSAWALCPDGVGGAFTAGSTSGNLGGPHAGSNDAWLARFDSAGTQTWVRQFGTSTSDNAYALCTDGAGGAFAAGDTRGNLGGSFAGNTDAWLARYDSAGNRTWIDQFGTGASDAASELCPSGAGGAFAAGQSGGSLGGPNAGDWDAFLARYGVACYPDCDTSTGPGNLDIFDFLCFGNRYDQRDPYACDCDTFTGPAVCDIFDFLCYQNAFAAGCS